MAVARYTLAVNRRYKRDGEQEADFISCVTFGKSAEFAQKYLHKGMRIPNHYSTFTKRYCTFS